MTAYVQQAWADGSGGGTPIEASTLTHIESGIGVADANATVALAQLGKPLALAGATAATRYVGGTASGAPVTGTFAVGDFAIDQSGTVWICTGSGTPGTWASPRLSFLSSSSTFFASTNGTIATIPLTVGTWLVNVMGDGMVQSSGGQANLSFVLGSGTMTLSGSGNSSVQNSNSNSIRAGVAMTVIAVVTVTGTLVIEGSFVGVGSSLLDVGYTAIKIA